MQALVLAGMIFHQLGMKIALQIRDHLARAWLSYDNLYDELAPRIWSKSRTLPRSRSPMPTQSTLDKTIEAANPL